MKAQSRSLCRQMHVSPEYDRSPYSTKQTNKQTFGTAFGNFRYSQRHYPLMKLPNSKQNVGRRSTIVAFCESQTDSSGVYNCCWWAGSWHHIRKEFCEFWLIFGNFLVILDSVLRNFSAMTDSYIFVVLVTSSPNCLMVQLINST